MAYSAPRPTYPLSLNQRNIWDLEQAYAGTSMNNISTTIRIRGRVDFALLQQTLHTILEKDSTLRTRLVLEGGEPRWYAADFVPETFPVYDFSHTSAQGTENWAEAMTRELIPLLDAPLYRFALFSAGDTAGGVFIKFHHIISDGWSQIMLCNRIGETYLALLRGEEPGLGEIPGYELHLQEEAAYLASPAYRRDKAYWQSVLEEMGDPAILKSMHSAAVSQVGRRASFALPQVLNHAIYTFCLENRVAPFAVFYMALAIYFRRSGGGERFTIGVPIFNRTNYTFKQCSGMFVSTLPLAGRVEDSWSLSQFNEQLAENWYELLRHQRFPFQHIAAMSSGGSRLFQVALSYQDSKIYESPDATVIFDGSWHYSGYQSEQLCIHLTNLEANRRYSVNYDYLTQFFSEEEILRLHENLVGILHSALSAPDTALCRLHFLDPTQQERVLYTFNDTDTPLAQRDVYDAFARVAAERASRVALISGGQRLTYGALQAQSGRYAAALLEREVTPGSLVAVVLPRSPALFAALLGGLRAGCAYLLLSPDLPHGRLADILRQSGAVQVITDPAIAKQCHLIEGDVPLLLPEALPAEAQPAPVAGGALAYVVYTSGTTGTPKGVEIGQRALLNLAQSMGELYGKGAVLSLCSVGFDAFVLESISALLAARTIVLPDPAELESPAALAALIRNYGVGFFAITPSRLAAFLKEPSFAAALGGLESIVCGGEAFSGALLQTLLLCTRARIYNQYGPSETTVAVSWKRLNDARAITIGKPMPNCRLYVLDPWRNPLPVGVSGELYIGGLCVGEGYRHAPEQTAQCFFPSPFETGERLYRTGDAAKWTEEGEIVLTGRLDQQTKLRGLRIEPQEVAVCLLACPGVTDAAARVIECNGQSILVAYYCADPALSEIRLLTHLTAYLPHYMIPAALLPVPSIPLTPNGKVDEKALPLPSLSAGDGQQTADGLLGSVLSVFRRVLSGVALDTDSDFFLAGGNSLNAMEALALLAEETGLALRVSDLYTFRTPRRLAQALAVQTGETVPAAGNSFRLTPAPALERYPLTAVQRGIYVQSLLDSSGLLYNMPGAFRFSAPPDSRRLAGALAALAEGDPIFRTRFVQEADGVFARIEAQSTLSLETLTQDSFDQAARAFVRPFDLANGPLLRAALWQEPQGDWYLFFDMHHIISDGLSTPLILNRLQASYAGGRPAPPAVFHKDYAYALSQQEPGGDLDWWTAHLSPLPAPLELPCDFARGKRFDHRGESRYYTFAPALAEAVDSACTRQGITPFVLLLGAFGLLLRQVSGRTHFTVGTPVSDRLLPQLKEVCGPLITTMPLGVAPEEALSVEDYLRRLEQEVTQLLSHRDVTPEQIISALELPRSVGSNPLFQVMFSLRPFDRFAPELGGPLTYCPLPMPGVKAELGLEFAREAEGYTLRIEYATSLFLPQTIDFYARCLEQLTQALCGDGQRTLGAISALAPVDRLRLWEEPDYTVMPFVNLPIHQTIARQAMSDPAAPAIFFHGQTMSRQAVESRADQIAHLLVARGVKPGQPVAFALSRSPELLCAMLGILKAGCPYVPMLDTYPAGRIRAMLEDAGASCLLCDQTTQTRLAGELGTVLLPLSEAVEAGPFAPVPVRGEELINILFTSGSTGRPKGVMVPHRAVANLLACVREYQRDERGPMLSITTPVFDIFIGETLLSLAMGRMVVMADEEEAALPWRMAALLEQSGATYMQFTSSRLQMCLSNEAFRKAAAGLRFTNVGGEAVSEDLVDLFKSCCPGRLANIYGPTEATVYATKAEPEIGEYVTIGKPLPNYRAYVLDEAGRRVLPTAVGELYLAGPCLAKGYVSRPELTEAAFVQDLLFPEETMYRTGDLARLRVDGSLDFLGRRDDQIKINGQRVQTQEITGAMTGCGLALQAAVLPQKLPDGSTELWGFYTPAAGKAADSAVLRAALQPLLPAYMIPSRLVALEQMPATASGKLDLQALTAITRQEAVPAALPVPEAEPVPQEEPAAEPEGPHRLLAIWQSVLGRKGDMDPDASFFQQGGSSLTALGVLSRYFNAGLTMTLEQFYENPTARAQAKLLWGETPVESSPATAPAQEAYPRFVPPPCVIPSRFETVLLTGATGFFGSHLLKALLESGVRRICCLVRGGERQRLLEVLTDYFGPDWVREWESRIAVLRGDVSQPHLGMDRQAFSALTRQVDAVYHAAADVRHYTTTAGKMLSANVSGTKNMIALAKLGNIPLLHISSGSVTSVYLTGEPERETCFTERDFYVGQNWADNVYVKSKFLAEAQIYAAMEKGLRAQIFRLGRLVPRTGDGRYQRDAENSMAYMLLKAMLTLEALPRTMAVASTDMTPVDWAAQAVVTLTGAPMTAMHIMQAEAPSLEAVVRPLCPELRVLPDEDFDQLLHQRLEQPAQAKMIAPLLNFWTEQKLHPPRITLDNGQTIAMLAQRGFTRRIPAPDELLAHLFD